MTDAELVAAYRSADDEDAFSELVRRYVPHVYRFIARLTGDPHEAEDLTQETFVKAWRSLDVYDAAKSFKTWIFAIAKNTVIDHHRKNAKWKMAATDPGEESSTDRLPDERPLADAVLQDAELKAAMEERLLELPEKTRLVLVMHAYDDMTFQEIAEVMGEPLNTVKSRYRRALLQPKNDAVLRRFFA